MVAFLETLSLANDIHQRALAAFRAETTLRKGLHRRESHALGRSRLLADGHGTWMIAHLLEHLGLDLTDALARDAEFLAHLLQRVADPVLEPEPHLDDLALAGRKELHHGVDVLLPQLAVG